MQTAFQIDRRDNVATALVRIEIGPVCLRGNTETDFVDALEEIQAGHKIALRDIKKDEPIVKYNVVIGKATTDIRKGSWIHLHCMRSLYDERSSHLDIHTGVPQDIAYE
jgi:altronate dehydratase small subunit